MEELDKAVTLEAKGVELSEDEMAEGMLDAYEITMQVDGQDKTEFAAPIKISVSGEYDNEKEYKVYREHEGEELQELECQVEDGKIEFQTNKFSKFTIVDPEAVDPDNPDDPDDPNDPDDPVIPPGQNLPFVDVNKGDWFYDSVYYNYFSKTMTGLDDTHFGPGQNLARAQFAVILHRINDEPKVDYTEKFPDVAANLCTQTLSCGQVIRE